MSGSIDVGAILAALACGDPRCECQRSLRRGQGKTHCPCHADPRPSLNLTVARDGTILVKCFGGCRNRDVIERLRELGLWPRRERQGHAGRETRYELRDVSGTLVAVHVRLDTPDGKRLWWEGPDGTKGLGDRPVATLPLYGVHRLGDTRDVVVVEGEKAADALLDLGVPAVGTVCGAAVIPMPEALRPLAGRRVYLWPDNDDEGRAHMAGIARRLAALGCADILVVDWPDAPPKGDAADLVAQGGTIEDVRRLMAEARRWQPGPSHAPPAPPSNTPGGAGGAFRLTALGDLLAEPDEEVAWTVEDLLPSGGVSLLGAKPKVGKSTTARCLALAVARGEPFLGRKTAQGPVIYLALEEKRAEVVKHFRRQGANGDDPIHVHVGMAPEAAMEALAAAVEAHKPTLVIVDPLLKLVRVRDANDYAEVTRALEPVIELARRSGSHIMLIHHLSKGERTGGDAILGSTALFGAVDTALLMRRHQDGTRTIETIQRYGEDLPESVIVLDEQTGRVTLAGTVAERKQAEAEEAILEALGDATLTEPEIREATQMQATLVARAIRALVEREVLERLGSGKKGDPYFYRRFSTSSTSSTSSTEPTRFSTSSTQTGSVEKSPRQDAENGGIFDSPPAPLYRVVGGESGGASPLVMQPNGHVARCPVCRQPYELAETDRVGWVRIRCRCQEGAWRWCRANDPALAAARLDAS